MLVIGSRAGSGLPMIVSMKRQFENISYSLVRAFEFVNQPDANGQHGYSNERGAFMANTRPTANKRQRERARQEKRQEKAQKKAQRKLEQEQSVREQRPAELTVTYDAEGRPEGFNFHDF